MDSCLIHRLAPLNAMRRRDWLRGERESLPKRLRANINPRHRLRLREPPSASKATSTSHQSSSEEISVSFPSKVLAVGQFVAPTQLPESTTQTQSTTASRENASTTGKPKQRMPRLYHKKSKTGCARCRARRVKVSASVVFSASGVFLSVSVSSEYRDFPREGYS
jgi:hypothetical protein